MGWVDGSPQRQCARLAASDAQGHGTTGTQVDRLLTGIVKTICDALSSVREPSRNFPAVKSIKARLKHLVESATVESKGSDRRNMAETYQEHNLPSRPEDGAGEVQCYRLNTTT